MAEPSRMRLFGFRGLFVGAVAFIVIVQLLPLRPEAGQLPGPDVILALTIAWAMRQTGHLPLVPLAVLMLLVDFLLMRPPGLMAALTVAAVEVVRAREDQWRSLPVLVEWLVGAALVSGVVALNALVLAVVLAAEASLGQTLIHLILTVAVYPVAMLAVRYLFAVPTRAGDGELGGRT